MSNSILTGKTAIVSIGFLEIDGILTTCGQFFIAIPQMVDANLIPKNRSAKEIETSLGIVFQSPTKIKTDIHPKAVNCISISDFRRIVKASAKKGNESADLLLDILLDLSLEQLFSDAFGTKFDKDDRQSFLKSRMKGKLERRTMTDRIQDYVAKHNIKDQYIYSNVSDLLNQSVLGMRAAEAKKQLGLKTGDLLRDSISELAIKELGTLEEIAGRYIDHDDLHPLKAVELAIANCRSKVVGLRSA